MTSPLHLACSAGSLDGAEPNEGNTPRNQLVARQCEWCEEETTDLQPHIRLGLLMCPECRTPRNIEKAPPKQKQPARVMWIYFIQAGGDGGPVKIGIADDPWARCSGFQTGNHLELRVVHRIRGTFYDEQELHRVHSEHKIRGEWFTAEVLEQYRPREPYLCDECGRRFFNLGWHAEACGSANFKRMERP